MEYQLGNFQEARRLFQEGVWADPGNKDAVYIFQVGECVSPAILVCPGAG
jgi:hypothetical protein